MKVYRHSDPMSEVSRQRRWTISEHDASHRFYDFRESPGLIPTVLEDFVPYADKLAVNEFFELIANANGPMSHFETNDSAFSGPHPNDSSEVSGRAIEISGRVMFYFRDLPLNTQRRFVEWLEEGVHFYLSGLAEDLIEGVVGTSIMRMHMPELGSDLAPADGFELCLHFWSWGDTEGEAWENLHVVIFNIHRTLSLLSGDAAEKRYLAAPGSGA